jgi:hypothetical protein
MTKTHLPASAAFLLTIGAAIMPVQAGERRFAFSYEADTAPAGTREFEQWLTWKSDKATNHDFDEFTFREEFEFGVTDRLQLGIYLADWRILRGTDDDGTSFKDTGFDLIYNLTNPTTDWLGSALYGEMLIGPDKFVLEGKLLLQKNIGKWVIAANTILEAEWEGEDLDEQVGVWENTLGVSYQVCPSLTIGAEAVHEVEFENWEEAGEHVFYAGPNFSYRRKNFFIVVAPLFQVSSIADEPDFMTRTIFGFHF